MQSQLCVLTSRGLTASVAIVNAALLLLAACPYQDMAGYCDIAGRSAVRMSFTWLLKGHWAGQRFARDGAWQFRSLAASIPTFTATRSIIASAACNTLSFGICTGFTIEPLALSFPARIFAIGCARSGSRMSVS